MRRKQQSADETLTQERARLDALIQQEYEARTDELRRTNASLQREIAGYAQLSQQAMKSTRMIADNVSQWKRAADGLRNS